MKKAEEFIPIMNKVSETVIVSERQYWNREFIVRLIKQAQLEAVEETVKLCAENAAMTGYYSEPSSVQSIRTKSIKRLWENKATGFKVEVSLKIDKDSILDCAEILKKEIE